MNSTKRRISRFLIIIIVVYTASRAILFSLRFILGTESPVVIVESTSMLPALKGGDMLVLQGRDDKSKIEIGDIIVFYNPNQPPPEQIVHRVKSIEIDAGELYFITKGDNNPIPDRSPVPQEKVIGVVRGKIPTVLSHYILFIDNIVVKITMLGVLFVFVISGLQTKNPKILNKGKDIKNN